MENKKNEMENLVEELNKYAHEYYVLDNPSVSDAVYDKKYDTLVALEKETGLIIPGSPTQRVGDKVLEGFTKVTHKHKLWSLGKSQTYDEIQSFITSVMKVWNDYKKINPDIPKPKFIVMQKLDGLTINTIFDESILDSSASRGTGIIGENITEQSKTITNLPQSIKYNNRLAVHGEVIMTKKAFKEYNANNSIPLKNLRNGASGSIRNLNLSECAKRKLSVMFYDITDTEETFENLSDKLNFIRKIGLPCINYTICDKYEDIIHEVEKIKDERASLQYDIDGVVIKVDNLELSEFMGYTVKYPKFATAYKFEPDETTTKLVNVEWNVGRTGRVNPTGILEPTDLGGVNIKRATLNNMDDIRKKRVKIGSEVIIRRSNDVIPEIMGIIDEKYNNSSLQEIEAPTICPACGSPLIKDGAFWVCENTLGCKPQLVKSIVHFCQREAMNIEGFSDKTAEQFVENNIINNVADLYKLEDKKDLILSLEKFGDKKYENLIKNIETSKDCSLYQLIYGLGIANVGLKTAKDLSKYFETLDNIKKATTIQLLEVPDIGSIGADCIYEWFNSDSNIKLLNEILKYVRVAENKKEITTKNPFIGKNVVVTGTLKNFTRSSIKSRLEELGAKSAGSVSKKTDYVLYGDNAGGKYDTAIELGVKTITEQEFLDMLK